MGTSYPELKDCSREVLLDMVTKQKDESNLVESKIVEFTEQLNQLVTENQSLDRERLLAQERINELMTEEARM
jgi:hypothetical protein